MQAITTIKESSVTIALQASKTTKSQQRCALNLLLSHLKPKAYTWQRWPFIKDNENYLLLCFIPVPFLLIMTFPPSSVHHLPLHALIHETSFPLTLPATLLLFQNVSIKNARLLMTCLLVEKRWLEGERDRTNSSSPHYRFKCNLREKFFQKSLEKKRFFIFVASHNMLKYVHKNTYSHMRARGFFHGSGLFGVTILPTEPPSATPSSS